MENLNENHCVPSYHSLLKLESSKNFNKKIAIFGGSFDPPTISHMILACEIYNQFDFIDEVWIVPCGEGRKDKILRTSIDDRIMMLKYIKNDIVYPDIPIFISTAEKDNGVFMPTYDLLASLKSNYPAYTFYFCFGSDLAISLLTWEYGSQIVNEFGLILMTRPGYDISNIPYIDKCNVLYSSLDTSSTVIRNRIETIMKRKNKVHLGISGITTKSVLEYIYSKNLYKIETDCLLDDY